ncbi:hypothetical protein SmJEL517_g03941 [Synchytrium microbalum]|uniref:Dihydroxyacetone kinase n=1 Tax=Synchytrium microbalum TaxID=1806994 RepID=A0A507C066_9FUNG|nr:uncharacterized protein SmJEL517_g03941 [Synchytrium microbalum]TPX33092.1 hypothetical protein SmJEL517_g03941 [Synchytrium microbalum]
MENTQKVATATKKLINDPDKAVSESLDGFILLNPHLKLLPPSTIIRQSKKSRVAVLSGGGSGHEPSHIGFVGNGMLDAAVCGSVFSSPTSMQVTEAVKAVSTGRGILMIVKNYTGDRLQFGVAAENLKRLSKEAVEMVIVADDCSIPRSRVGGAGRRGLAGTVFVHKIAGSAARSGLPLQEVARRATLVSKLIGTVGVALSSCSVPGQPSTFEIGANEIELGLGIHGEPGYARIQMATSKQIVRACLDRILDPSDEYHYLQLFQDDLIALMVNNMGATSILEMGIVVNDAVQYLTGRGYVVVRIYSGHFMTSLEMQGVSLSILRIPEGSEGDTILASLDEPVECSSWKQPVLFTNIVKPSESFYPAPSAAESTTEAETFTPVSREALKLHQIITTICESLISNRDRLNELDRLVGDGDCGSTLSTAANSLLEVLGGKDVGGEVWESGIDLDSPLDIFHKIAETSEKHMGGTMGAFFSIFFNAAANSWKSELLSVDHLTSLTITKAFEWGLAAVESYGGAKLGDRTLIDALRPALEAMSIASGLDASTKEILDQGILAARVGATATSQMPTAKFGRSSYIGKSLAGSPDPGAESIVIILEAIAEAMTE